MDKHKSFVLKRPKKHVARAPKPMASAPKPMMEKTAPAKPKKEDKEIVVAHYDDNRPMTLSLPQSLFLANELSHDMDAEYVENEWQHGHSLSLEEEDEDGFYSDANEHFTEEHENLYHASDGHPSPDNRFTEAASATMRESEPKGKASGETSNGPSDETIGTNVRTGSSVKSQEETDETSEEKFHGDATSETKKKSAETVHEPSNTETMTEEDKKFEEDLKAIMEGKKTYDRENQNQNTAQTPKHRPQGVSGKNENNRDLEDKLKNEHAIFDKIAQSMEMASSYDLGSIAMDKKFDDLEEETDETFTEKIHQLLDKKKTENETEGAEETDVIISQKKEGHGIDGEQKGVETAISKKQVETSDEDDFEHPQNKDVSTKDFLNDLDAMGQKEKEGASSKELSVPSDFDSTISIRHRYLKSRIFPVGSGSIKLSIDSRWKPVACSDISELSVTLTQLKGQMPDSEKGTKKFKIGKPDSQVWNNLEPGDYYLVFFFDNNTDPNCELTGNIKVRT